GNQNGNVVGINKNEKKEKKETGRQKITVSGEKINVANIIQGQERGENITNYENKKVKKKKKKEKKKKEKKKKEKEKKKRKKEEKRKKKEERNKREGEKREIKNRPKRSKAEIKKSKKDEL
ncbi:hypothetical protein, partial [Acinetobacter baumannii]|uniref:hypothetical protein n=1 Tax=Acinetobacter baumannii TaxID=470 RepID=UPI0022782FC3